MMTSAVANRGEITQCSCRVSAGAHRPAPRRPPAPSFRVFRARQIGPARSIPRPARRGRGGALGARLDPKRHARSSVSETGAGYARRAPAAPGGGGDVCLPKREAYKGRARGRLVRPGRVPRRADPPNWMLSARGRVSCTKAFRHDRKLPIHGRPGKSALTSARRCVGEETRAAGRLSQSVEIGGFSQVMSYQCVTANSGPWPDRTRFCFTRSLRGIGPLECGVRRAMEPARYRITGGSHTHDKKHSE